MAIMRASNADEIGQALDTLIDELQQLRDDLEGDEVVGRVFESAATWRAILAERVGKKRAGS